MNHRFVQIIKLNIHLGYLFAAKFLITQESFHSILENIVLFKYSSEYWERESMSNWGCYFKGTVAPDFFGLLRKSVLERKSLKKLCYSFYFWLPFLIFEVVITKTFW